MSSYQRQEGNNPYFSVAFGADVPRPNVKTVRRLFIDNRDRPAGSDPFNFTINLEQAGVAAYDNVVNVELKGLSFPKVASEPYVILDIAELNDTVMDSTNDAANKAYAMVYFDNNQMTAGDVKPIKGADFYMKQVQYVPPIRRLDRLSLRFLKHSGAVITTADTGNNSNVTLLFEVTSGTRSN